MIADAHAPAPTAPSLAKTRPFPPASPHFPDPHPHLCRYERLQKILVLSAIKRTSARVKFWFIKNYMSPQMKAFLPYMARHYGFDYE